MLTIGRTMAAGAGAAAAIAILGSTGATPAQAQACTPQFTSSAVSFVSRLCGMPDYDQRRAAATLQGDGRTINESSVSIGPVSFSLALPKDGGCHCVPTSFTNLLGYYVGKGVVGSFPRAFAWDARADYAPRPGTVPAASYLNGQPYPANEVSAYNAATVAIKTLGQGVQTTPDPETGKPRCGTSWGTVLDYFKNLRSLYPKVGLAISTSTPGFAGPKQVANILAAGGTVSIAYGRFPDYNETAGGSLSNTATWGARSGGHAVTVREVTGVNLATKTAQFKLSDPAGNSDPVEAGSGNEDKFRQSATAERVVNLTRVLNPTQAVFRWRFGDIGTSGDTPKTAIWDSMLVAYPVMAVMTNGGSVQLFPGLQFNRTGTSAPAVPTELRAKSFSLGTRTSPVLDAAFLPATGEIAYIRKGDGSVRAIAVGTRETRVIGTAPAGVTQLEPDATGAWLFAGGASEIRRFDPSSEKGDPETFKTPAAVRALSFDQGTSLGAGKLVAITADRGLHRIDPTGLKLVGTTQRLSRALFDGTGPLAATVDPKGQLFLRRGSAQRLGRVGLANRTVKRATLGTLQGNGGLAIGERGTVFSVVGGKLVELTPGGSAAPNSVFAGRTVSGRVLQVTRGGSSLPAEMSDQIIDERVVDPDFPEMAP